MAQTRQDIEKRFSASFRGIKNEVFPVKIWHLKFSFSSFAEFTIFAKISKNHVLSFLLMSGLYVVNGQSDFFIFDKVIRITVKVSQSELPCL